MTAKALRKQAHELIDQVDDDFLLLLNQLLNDRIRVSQPVIALSADELKEQEPRKMLMRSGKDKSLDAEKSVKAVRDYVKKHSK
jgi:hypothetical protein